MSAPTLTRPITTEELLAMPEDGMDRWLVNGELRERPMTTRNRFHSEVSAMITGYMVMWLLKQPKPRGSIVNGEAGVRLSRDPETTFGVDVAYFAADVPKQQRGDTTIIDGVPTLVVEVLSPSDTQEDILEKIRVYLRLGVPLVWIVEPLDQTIRVYRPKTPPVLFNIEHEISCEPWLPGFSMRVADVFEGEFLTESQIPADDS